MSTDWIVEIDVLGGAFTAAEINEKLEDLLAELSPYDPVVTGSPEEGAPRFGATLSIMASDAVEACIVANEAFASALKKTELPQEVPVRCEVRTVDDFEDGLERPTYPRFVGIQELARTLNVSKQRASELARANHFPEPVAELASGPIWTEPMIHQFVVEWERRPGRPRTKQSAPSESKPHDHFLGGEVRSMAGRRTSPRAAKAASKVLRSGRTGKASKTAAASALSQRSKGGSGKGKK